MWLADKNIQENYRIAIEKSIVDENSFKSFKNNLHYNSIVGMSESWQAPLFYDFIKNNNKNIFDKINIFIPNDSIGNPSIWVSEDGFKMSSNTLRYIKTLVDLENNFGSLNGYVVSELGVGYGGLAYIINTYYHLKDYILNDIPIVEEFAKKYLSSLNISLKNDKNLHKNFDLFISEFCLSEFDDEQIYEFYNSLILKANRIYLMMNLHDEIRKNNFLNKISKDFNIKIIDEYPKTMWPNYIIIGNRK